MEADNSSALAATVCTFAEAYCDDEAVAVA
jgi:hypothetical protein